MSYIGIIVTFVFVNNVVLTQLLGLCPALGVTKRMESTVGLGVAVTVVAAIASLITWLFDHLVLVPLGVEFLQIIVVVLSAAGTAHGLEWIVSKSSKGLRDSIGLFLPLVTANCAVVGVALIAARSGYGPLESFVAGASGGAGAMMAMLLLSTLREKMESEWVPKALRGTPITLITAGLMAMAFLAFDKAFLVKLIG